MPRDLGLGARVDLSIWAKVKGRDQKRDGGYGPG